jgi:hypothetical protein
MILWFFIVVTSLMLLHKGCVASFAFVEGVAVALAVDYYAGGERR